MWEGDGLVSWFSGTWKRGDVISQWVDVGEVDAHTRRTWSGCMDWDWEQLVGSVAVEGTESVDGVKVEICVL